MEESIYELREAVGLEEINRLLATGRWKVRSLDWDDEIPWLNWFVTKGEGGKAMNQHIEAVFEWSFRILLLALVTAMIAVLFQNDCLREGI